MRKNNIDSCTITFLSIARHAPLEDLSIHNGNGKAICHTSEYNRDRCRACDISTAINKIEESRDRNRVITRWNRPSHLSSNCWPYYYQKLSIRAALRGVAINASARCRRRRDYRSIDQLERLKLPQLLTIDRTRSIARGLWPPSRNGPAARIEERSGLSIKDLLLDGTTLRRVVTTARRY